MSEYAEGHRRAMKAKARRLAHGDDEHGKVDATTVKRPPAFDADKKVGKPRNHSGAYKDGGKVEGEGATHHAGRAKRQSGGRIAPIQAAPFHGHGIAPRIGNRAPDLPPVGVSSKHPGMNLPLARKSGGRAKRDAGGAAPEVPTSRMSFSPAKSELAAAAGLGASALKCGGKAEREGRASGGRAKGKTNINIVIAQPGPAAAQAPGIGEPPEAPKPAGMPQVGAPPPVPPPAPQAMPSSMGGGANGGGFGGPMPRRRGGRT